VRVKKTHVLAVLLSAVTLAACDFLRGYAEGHSASLQAFQEQDITTAQLGAARLLFDDFGGLSTDSLEADALPWKLVAASLVLKQYPDRPATVAHLHEILESFGFIFPESVGNWPLSGQPEFQLPLGLVSGVVKRDVPRIEVEVANLGCASCHAGVTYDATGAPQKTVWLGLPNTSIDLDAYTSNVRDALLEGAKHKQQVSIAIRSLFPEVTGNELATLRDRVLPKLIARLRHSQPFNHGGPGRADEVAALSAQLHLEVDASTSSASVSIPEIGNVGLRWSLLADGLFTRSGEPRFQPRAASEMATPNRAAPIVAFFSLPSMGLQVDKSEGAVVGVTDVLAFLSDYESPKYPGLIDEAAATRGAVIYARCAECHGEYVEHHGRLQLRSFPNRLSTLAEIGTDSKRVDAVNGEFVAAAEFAAPSKSIDAEATRGIVAPSLAGLWATAPYLHNGSVPTIDALMTPAERPARFWVGGHRLDFARLGIAGDLNARGEYAYPAGYLPWAVPRLYDTAAPGHSNRGHEREFDGLSAADKRDLIEFLKQL
jgi:hypothetical protein